MSRPHLHVLSAALAAQEASYDLINVFFSALVEEIEDADLPPLEEGQVHPALMESVASATKELFDACEEHMQSVMRKGLNDALAVWAALQRPAN